MRPVTGKDWLWALLLAAAAVPAVAAPEASDQPALMNVPMFAIYEQAFTQQQSYTNPYVQVTANVAFTPPAGPRRSIPLFWDGGAKWKVRFSPDAVGAWSWSVNSNDPGLNGAKGSFHCVSSTHHGGIVAMAGYPYHFQHQDGTPYWLFGDTSTTFTAKSSGWCGHRISTRAAGSNQPFTTTARRPSTRPISTKWRPGFATRIRWASRSV